MDNRFIIIDGNSLINRAYYAMQRPMVTKDGVFTQGVYGFIRMLQKIEKEYPSGYICVTFDRKAPTFRHLEYEEYKAGRKKMPPELAKDVVDRGIVLTGGVALLNGFAERLSRTINTPVIIAEKPLFSVALGVGKILENLGTMRRVLTSIERGSR